MDSGVRLANRAEQFLHDVGVGIVRGGVLVHVTAGSKFFDVNGERKSLPTVVAGQGGAEARGSLGQGLWETFASRRT